MLFRVVVVIATSSRGVRNWFPQRVTGPVTGPVPVNRGIQNSIANMGGGGSYAKFFVLVIELIERNTGRIIVSSH